MNETPNFASKFTHHHTVTENEIDDLNHVNNVVYVQWVNDISGLHWFSKAPEDIAENYIWVVIRHELDYIKPAFLNEEVRIETWIETLQGVRSIRIVHVYRDNTLLVKARTTWCLLDAKTKRITRVTPEMQAMFSSIESNFD